MGQTAGREKFKSTRSGPAPVRALRATPGRAKTFLSPQALQAIENPDSARENPRKSKPKEPFFEAHFAARPRLAGNIQTPNLLRYEAAAKFSARAPCNPLKTNDRRPFAAENGGKRRSFKHRIARFFLPESTVLPAAQRHGVQKLGLPRQAASS
jgi:hypothetical protein